MTRSFLDLHATPLEVHLIISIRQGRRSEGNIRSHVFSDIEFWVRNFSHSDDAACDSARFGQGPGYEYVLNSGALLFSDALHEDVPEIDYPRRIEVSSSVESFER
jgi:hypothetical protein